MKRVKRGHGAGIVTLTTDFGTADGYAASLKGVILAALPRANVVDLAHDLAHGDVAAASALLARAAPLFPSGTVHVAVVDPGVGTERRGLALAVGGQRYVGPDNGIFTGVLSQSDAAEARALENQGLWRPEVSPVFHGRDIFAPVAAYLAAGGELGSVGSAVASESLVRLASPVPTGGAAALRGEVVHVDRFGNLVTNLPAPAGARGAAVEVAGRALPLSRTYGDVAPGALVAVVGSSGMVEIAVRDGSAAAHLGAGAGLVIILRAPRESV